MDIKTDMVVEIVYEKSEGMYPLEIAEAVSKRYQIQATTRQVEQIVKKNPKLFVEKDSKIYSPSQS